MYMYLNQTKIKVHVWAGISRKGRTGICVFEGKMNAELYVEILNNTLLSFIEKVLPDHRLFQDNDQKHTSRRAQKFMMKKRSLGGKHHLDLLMLMLLKISGINITSLRVVNCTEPVCLVLFLNLLPVMEKTMKVVQPLMLRSISVHDKYSEYLRKRRRHKKKEKKQIRPM